MTSWKWKHAVVHNHSKYSDLNIYSYPYNMTQKYKITYFLLIRLNKYFKSFIVVTCWSYFAYAIILKQSANFRSLFPSKCSAFIIVSTPRWALNVTSFEKLYYVNTVICNEWPFLWYTYKMKLIQLSYLLSVDDLRIFTDVILMFNNSNFANFHSPSCCWKLGFATKRQEIIKGNRILIATYIAKFFA